MAPLSLYLHFPFCARKCAYCDFCSRVPAPGEMGRYLQALRQEIEARAAEAEGRVVQTVYFGGGTPTLYPVEDLAEILDLLRKHFALRPESPPASIPPLSRRQRDRDEGNGLTRHSPLPLEITCEANPGTVDETYLRRLREAGVNRLSLGVQSFRAPELRLLGRLHTSEQAREAVAAARAAGFDNLNLDLITALPGQTLAHWEENLDTALSLAPEHLSCYGLALEPGTPLAEAVARGDLVPLPEDTAAALWECTDEVLAAAGYEHYEISNFARPGFRCRHNLNYWRNGEYVGFGISAASYLQEKATRAFLATRGRSAAGRAQPLEAPAPLYRRSRNVADIDEYMRRLEGGESAEAESECLSPARRLAETIMLALRTAEGVDPASLRVEFGETLVTALEPVAAEMRRAGLLADDPHRWRPTRRGMLLNNRLAAAFL